MIYFNCRIKGRGGINDFMKIAEALILRADLQKRLEQIRARLYNNVLIQEGEEPSEQPGDLLKEFQGVQKNLKELIKVINQTNHQSSFNDELTIAEALVERDALLSQRNLYLQAAERASEKQDRYSRTEIKSVSTIDVKEFQKKADDLAKKYRQLDTKIQGLNWNIDLI